MKVKFKKIALLAMLLCWGQFWSINFAGSAEASRTTIVYDGAVRFGDQISLVTALAEHLGHFTAECRVLPTEQWQPGLLADADTVVYVGLRAAELPAELLREIASAKRVIWFERNIEQLAKQLQWSDFKIGDQQTGWTYLNYNNQVYHEWGDIWLTDPGDAARIIATAKNVDVNQPLVWQRNNVYYVGLLEFFGSYDEFFGSVFHDFFPEHQCPSKPQALLRIEDVSPLIDTDNLQTVLDTAARYNIPFAIGVIPVGISGGKKVYLHENKKLVAVLQAAQARGASIIMHGYTHQNEFSPTTGEGYEFWNARDNKPMENELAFTRERLEAGLNELVRAGLLPVAFEAPHYAAGKQTYQMIAQYFNIYSGEIQISDKTAAATMSLPYIIKSPYLAGMTVIPENMGYYDGSPLAVKKMLDASRSLLAVPGRFACFFYHGYLPPDKLGEIISGMQEQGYQFLDLRAMPVKVEAKGIAIYSENGNILADIDPSLRAAWQDAKPSAGALADKVINIQVMVLFVIITILLIIIVKLQKNAKKHYEG